jgi:hypothetical protein
MLVSAQGPLVDPTVYPGRLVLVLHQGHQLFYPNGEPHPIWIRNENYYCIVPPSLAPSVDMEWRYPVKWKKRNGHAEANHFKLTYEGSSRWVVWSPWGGVRAVIPGYGSEIDNHKEGPPAPRFERDDVL